MSEPQTEEQIATEMRLNDSRSKDPVRVDPKTGKQTRTVIVQMEDVKKYIYTRLREDKPTSQKGLNSYLRMGGRNDPFAPLTFHDFTYDKAGERVSPNTVEVLKWLDYGFVSDEMQHSANTVPLSFTTRPAWSEDDGDIDVGRLAAGYDDFYMGRTEQQSKPGIILRFDCWFSCGVPGPVIAEYGLWIMKLITGMEASGFDLTIDAWCVVDNAFQKDGHSRNIRSNIGMRVKNIGENNDMTSYSCLFSPFGTRGVVFTAMHAAAEQCGVQGSSWFGTAVMGRNWDLNYDQETNIVQITAAQTAVWSKGSGFPNKELTAKAREYGLIPDNGNEEL